MYSAKKHNVNILLGIIDLHAVLHIAKYGASARGISKKDEDTFLIHNFLYKFRHICTKLPDAHIVFACDSMKSKRKEIFDTALEEVLKNHPGATKEEIFYIGDTYKTDVIGAYDAGIKPVWINRNGEADDKAYASYEIESILDLIGVI